MQSVTAAVVITEGLTHNYGDVRALDRVTLEIPPGITGLVGANGAGKTTLLRILLGLIHPTGGRAMVMGHDAVTDPLSVRSRSGYMPENNCLPKDQTAADFVAFAAELAGLPTSEARQRASETLFLVGLEEERFRFLGDFSTGMAQRVKLAQAIVHGPELVLLDEPNSGLDPVGREQMLDLIRRLGAFGINVIFSSHVLSDIEETCQSVVLLDGGHLVRSGPVEGLGDTSNITIEMIGRVEPFIAELRRHGLDPTGHNQQVVLTNATDEVFDLVRDTAAALNLGILRMTPATRSLEDEFLTRTGEE
jgi:ABC-2 type transport system ATP-binding protein